MLCPTVKDPVVDATGTFVTLLPLKVGVPYRAFGIVPEVKFDAERLDKSTCCVIDELDNLASAKVPEVIFDVAKSGIRASANVPDAIADAGNAYLLDSYVLILFLHQ